MVLATLLAAIAFVSEPATITIVEDDEAFPIPGTPNLTRGYLHVSESSTSHRRLTLPFAIVEASDTQSAQSPVVYIGGGPGIGSLAAAQYPGAYPWTSERDFLVYARRGTLGADPSMRCEELGQAFASTDSETTLNAVAACRDTLLDQGVDLNAYNTLASARDLEALRKALGYETLSLFALSYGTRLALTYAREFPNRVDALVLDGPLPHTVSFDEAYPASVESVLRAVTQYCGETPACDAVYPELEARFFDAIEAQLSGTISQEPSAAQLALAALPGDLSDMVGSLARMDAIARGDLDAVQSRVRSGRGGSDFVWAVRLSVWCSERKGADGGEAAGATFAGLDGSVFASETCEAWGVTPRPGAELQPLVGDIPTLILAGALDTLTPPQFGEIALVGLERARLIALPLGFHTETTNWGGDGCALGIAAAFFEDPETVLSSEAQFECIAGYETLDFILLMDERQRVP